MNIPGLLIEYLVVGSAALVWFFPLLGVPFFAEKSLSFEKAAALAPALYVLGMCVDYVAFVLVSVPKNRCLKALVRNKLRAELAEKGMAIDFPATGGGRSTHINLTLQTRAPEFLKELDTRSSRDRIARSTVVNFLALALVLWLACNEALGAAAVMVAAAVTLAMWASHEHSTSRVELMAYQEALRRPEKQ